MIRTDKQHFLHNLNSCLFIYMTVGTVLLILSPPALYLPGTALILLTLTKHIHCTYLTTSFTECFSYILTIILVFFAAFSYVITSTLINQYAVNSFATSYLIGLISPAVHILQYVHAYHIKKFNSPFIITGSRVTTTYPKRVLTPRAHLIMVGACTGLMSLTFPYLEKFEYSLLLFGFLMLLFCAYFFHYMRNAIAGIRELKQYQINKNTILTFCNLEEINALRRSSWIGRGLNKIFNRTH